MLNHIGVRERGITPKNLRKAHQAAASQAWYDTGLFFHQRLRDKRFTPEHAKEAGYAMRKGQGLSPNAKSFRRSYYGRKLTSADLGGGPGRADPLVFSGETRELVRRAVIEAGKRGTFVKIKYPGARKLNFRNPKSKIRMSDEFRRITAREADTLARHFDDGLDLAFHEMDRKS